MATVRSLSHHGLELGEGLLSGAAPARAFWMTSDRVSAYRSSWSFDGVSLLSRGVNC